MWQGKILANYICFAKVFPLNRFALHGNCFESSYVYCNMKVFDAALAA